MTPPTFKGGIPAQLNITVKSSLTPKGIAFPDNSNSQQVGTAD